jgi:hypothetical protein
MFRFARRTALTLILGMLLVACDSGGDSGDGNQGPQFQESFTMTISGNGINETYEGIAYWAEAPDNQGDTAFAISLSSNSSTDAAATGLIFRTGQRPGTGTYSVANIDDEASDPLSNFAIYLIDASATNSFTGYFSDGGDINITESTGNVVAGNFTIPGTLIQSSPNQQDRIDVTIDCTFEASNNPGFVSL